ncbi:MAG: rhodanese-related sulfurtransferase [Bacteroidia bacterium]|jgi:rhodanese-related sulfurtransferase
MIGDITVTELKQRLDAGETLNIIDVREPWEYEEYNINGKLIPLGDLQGKLDDLEDWMNDEIIVYCKSGGRSAAAVDYMTRQGFKKARNLTGGMMDWQSQNQS